MSRPAWATETDPVLKQNNSRDNSRNICSQENDKSLCLGLWYMCMITVHTSLGHTILGKVVSSAVVFWSLLLPRRAGVFNKINPEHSHEWSPVWPLAFVSADRASLPTTSFYPSPVGGRWGCLKAKLEILSNLSLSFFLLCFFFSTVLFLVFLFSCFWCPSPKREGSGNDLLPSIDWLVNSPLKCPHTAALPASLLSLIVQEAYSSLGKLYFLWKLLRNCF